MSLPIHRISSARFLRAPKSEFTSSKHATETPRKTTISYVYHEPVLGRTAIMFAIDTRWTQKNHCESNASKRREENLKLPTMEPMRTVHLALFYYNFRFFFSFFFSWLSCWPLTAVFVSEITVFVCSIEPFALSQNWCFYCAVLMMMSMLLLLRFVCEEVLGMTSG